MTIPDADVLANAEAAYSEIRAQIDHQIRSSDSIDTKAWGLVTVTGVIAGLIAPRIVLDSEVRAYSALVVFGIAAVVVALSVIATRPVAAYSFGPDPDALVKELESYSRVAIALSTAESIAKARGQNVTALDAKSAWYQAALVAFGVMLAGLAWLVYVRAVQ